MDAMPRVFRWIDALTFGLAAILATSAAVWAQTTEQPTSAYVVTWVTAAGFWFVYGMLLLGRLRLRQNVSYVSRHGLIIMWPDQRPTPLRQEVEDLTEQVLAAWVDALDGKRSPRVRRAVEGLFVIWKPFPFSHRARPGFKFTGLASGNTILVGYREPLATTAFAHELGHIIYMAVQGPHTEEEFAAFTSVRGLPA